MTEPRQEYTHTCRCGHDWRSFLAHPRCCPKCKSYEWDQPFKRGPKAQPDPASDPSEQPDETGGKTNDAERTE